MEQTQTGLAEQSGDRYSSQRYDNDDGDKFEQCEPIGTVAGWNSHGVTVTRPVSGWICTVADELFPVRTHFCTVASR